MTASLSPFLDLTREQAKAQWAQIMSRRFVPRQEKYTAVEVLLCHGLVFILNPHRYGGANIHTAPRPVHVLAKTFKRTPGSLTNKMLNLDGSRKNGGRLEPELFLRLTEGPDGYVHLYLQIMMAARDMGLGEEHVPDFLELSSADDGLLLLGQDELGSVEIDTVVSESASFIQDRSSRWETTEVETTRLVVQRARIGQHRFSKAVLDNYGHACGFCGFAPGDDLKGNRLLIASHIKPWKDSKPKERLDPRNGVAACPVHDVAFDRGLLTVNGGLRIHRADVLRRRLEEGGQVARFLGEDGVLERLLVQQEHAGPHKRYLQYHREHVFRGAGR